MSFEAAFILVVFIIPGTLGLFLKFWGWLTEERFWKHRRTASDSINDFLRNCCPFQKRILHMQKCSCRCIVY